MAGKKVTGRVEIKVTADNGINTTLLNKAGAVASGLGINREREAVLYDGGVAGYKENIVQARCEVTVIDREDVLLSKLGEIFENGTIVFQATDGSGKQYVMNNATCLGNFSLTAGDGEVPMVFEGEKWQEGTI